MTRAKRVDGYLVDDDVFIRRVVPPPAARREFRLRRVMFEIPGRSVHGTLREARVEARKLARGEERRA